MRALPRSLLLLLLLLCTAAGIATGDPLPHWRDRVAKARIVEFVQAVADPASPDFVPQPERIAVFDEVRDGGPAIVRLPALDFLDDKAGKPVGIQRFIGRRPILAFGNSDGDFEMLEWVTSGPGRRLGLLVHHDDAAREFSYDRSSAVGRLARGLDEAPQRGWLVVSMHDDWTSVYPAASPAAPAASPATSP